MCRHIFLLLISALFFLQPSAHGNVINVATQDDFGKLLSANNLVVVKFFTTWCGACTAVEEPFDQLSQDSTINDVAFAQVDIDTVSDVGSTYNIEYIPQFLFFKNGKMVKKQELNSLDTLKQDMLDQITLLQNTDDAELQEQEVSAQIQESGKKEKGYLASFIELLMIPITFVMNILEKLFGTIKSWFA